MDVTHGLLQLLLNPNIVTEVCSLSTLKGLKYNGGSLMVPGDRQEYSAAVVEITTPNYQSYSYSFDLLCSYWAVLLICMYLT